MSLALMSSQCNNTENCEAICLQYHVVVCPITFNAQHLAGHCFCHPKIDFSDIKIVGTHVPTNECSCMLFACFMHAIKSAWPIETCQILLQLLQRFLVNLKPLVECVKVVEGTVAFMPCIIASLNWVKN